MATARQSEEESMGLVVLLLVLALVFGGVGLAVASLKWLLIIAGVLLLISFFTGYRSYGHRHTAV